MAGRIKHKQEMACIAQQEDQVRLLLESGKSLRQVGEETGLVFQRLHEWVNKPERSEWWKAVRRMRANGLAEDSLDVLKKATRDDIAVAREQSRSMQWLAERMAPDDWGAKGGQINLQVNVAQAFVQAMREEI